MAKHMIHCRTRSGSIYIVEKVEERYYVRESNSSYVPYIIDKPCHPPELGRPLFIDLEDKNKNTIMTSTVMEAVTTYE